MRYGVLYGGEVSNVADCDTRIRAPAVRPAGGFEHRRTRGPLPRRRLRILMLNFEYPPLGGGTATAAYHLLRRLGGWGTFLIDLVTSRSPEGPAFERLGPRVRIFRLEVGKRDVHYWRSGEILRWIHRASRLSEALSTHHRYDVCHCWMGWPAGWIGYFLRGRFPFLIGLRGSDVPGYNDRLRLLDALLLRPISRRVWRAAAFVTANSEALKRLALKTAPDLDIKVIRNGAEEVEPARMPELPPIRILFTGRLIKRKGVVYVLEALRLLSRRAGGRFRLVVAGEGPERRRLQSLAEKWGLGSIVRFHGNVRRENLGSLYRSSHVFVMPSIEESLANAVLEAAAYGLAIVTTDTGVAEAIDGNGFVVPRKTPKALASALEWYARCPELLERHRLRSVLCSRVHSWNAAAYAYGDLYLRAVGADRSLHVGSL